MPDDITSLKPKQDKETADKETADKEMPHVSHAQ